MFYNLKSLPSVNLSSFDTSNVVNMYAMLYGLSSLTTLNLSNFDTSNVKNMGYMFANTSALQSLDLTGFNTSKVTNTRGMFELMKSITEIKFSNKFDTSNVNDMSMMFAQTDSLVEVDLSNFRTPKVQSFRAMFYTEHPESNKTKRIYASSDFDTAAALAYQSTDSQANIDIFWKMKNLVGGNGTRSENNSTPGIQLLKIDRPGVPGLFTRKP